MNKSWELKKSKKSKNTNKVIKKVKRKGIEMKRLSTHKGKRLLVTRLPKLTDII